MLLKTQTLSNIALDYAVIICLFPRAFEDKPSIKTIVKRYPYSANWALAGFIIEREEIMLDGITTDGITGGYRNWNARKISTSKETPDFKGYGPTALVAAMRCFVASKFGDIVEVPDEFELC